MNIANLMPELPFTNPILIFFIVLLIILFAPLLLNKLRIPHIIGLLLAGMIIGPNGLGLLLRDSSFQIFGNVGLLYIMFLAGLEMDMNDFKQNRTKGIVFGIYTFIIPMALGTVISYYVLDFSLTTSVLLASMYASHTLVAYPIISRYGISRSPAVVITVGGTIITVMGALIILAVITGMYRGSINFLFWARLIVSIAAYTAFIIYVFPRLTRWFLQSYSDNVVQYIFIMALLFCSSFLAEAAGLEGIIGAFLAGIVLNRYIPAVSPLMNRIEFVGNALFIPYFLIGVGMLIDLKILFSNTEALMVAINMTIVATVAKWLAAYATQKTFKMNRDERNLMFGLSNGQAAATLAAVLIGYNIIIGTDALGEPIRLLNENVLNGTIIMILVTCATSSIVTERAAKKIVTSQLKTEVKQDKNVRNERMLIPVANPATIENLINTALLLKNPKKRSKLFAIYVNDDQNERIGEDFKARMALSKAAKVASSADTPIETSVRYDMNIASGIIHTIKEKEITEVVIGLHYKANIVDTFLGTKTEMLLKGTNKMIVISKCLIPINTVTRIVVAVPEKAEYETGFPLWIDRLANMAGQVGCRIIFYAHRDTLSQINGVLAHGKYNIRSEFESMDSWNDLPLLVKVVLQDDLFVIINARHTSISHSSELNEIPHFLSHNFAGNNIMVVYPEQFGEEREITFFSDPMAVNVQHHYMQFTPFENKIKKWFGKHKI